MLVCGENKRLAAGVGKRNAGLQCFAVFVSAIKPHAADSDHDAASRDHKSLGDVVHGSRLGLAVTSVALFKPV